MSAMVDLEQFRAPVQEWKDKVLLPRWYHDQDEARHDEADRLLAIIDGAKAAALRQSGEAVATLPIDVRGQWFDVPIPVHLHLIALREQLACDVSGQPFIRNLLVHTEHCLSAADEGVDYAVSREMLEAMTAIGLMEKVRRGSWAPTDAAEKFVKAARTSSAPPATSGLVEALRLARDYVAGELTQLRAASKGYEAVGNVQDTERDLAVIDAALAAHDARDAATQGAGS